MSKTKCCFVGGLLTLYVLWATLAHAQAGCSTVVLPTLTNTAQAINTLICVPPGLPANGNTIFYPVTYVVPSNGTTTGVETTFHRVVTTQLTSYLPAITPTGAQTVAPTVSTYVADCAGGWHLYEPGTFHTWYYQTMPHQPGITDTQSIPFLRTQHHSTALEEFQNLSVVLQPPKNGLTGETWGLGFLTQTTYSVQVESQTFFRECVVVP